MTTTATCRPRRVQQRRVAGWRKPPGAVAVGRGTPWGNPYHWDEPAGAPIGRAEAVRRFIRYVVPRPDLVDAIRAGLRGKVLMCWCRPGQPCHADVLLAIANSEGDLDADTLLQLVNEEET